ncbi:MAG: hypothetical protein IT375_28470 [Polyangiaceae bacterium]|mgnify:FL=1|nr:hypothetical protein [Polyangiaceae bacterium]
MEESKGTYEAARALFLEQPASNGRVWLLLGTAVLFTLGATGQSGWRNALVLLAVVLLHELGHFIAMRAVG